MGSGRPEDTPRAGPDLTPPTLPATSGTGVAAPTERERWVVPGYEVHDVLGRGGFGLVLAGRRTADGAPVALKVARGEAAARSQLSREAEALRAVGAPAAPALLDQGTLADGSPFLAMERIALPTLQGLLETLAGPMDPAELGPRALAILDALAAVHASGWAHCDLKPANVFVGEDLRVARLFDFGLAERLDEEAAPVPAAGRSFAGTAEYMSPEQCDGRARPDARSDVYAAGVLLYQMLTGRPPFSGSAGEVHQAHLNLRPPRPSDLAAVSPGVEQVVLRCLAKEPSARYGDAFLLRAALTAALARDALAPAPRAAVAPAPGQAPAQEKRQVAVLFLRSAAGALEIQAAAAACGGLLAHAGAGRYAVVFDSGTNENPVRMAVQGAFRLAGRGLAERALVDLVAASVQRKEGDPPRYLSPAFGQVGRYPDPADPPGPLVSGRAAELLPEGRFAAVPGREGILRVLPESHPADDPTVIRQQAAPLVGREAEIAALLARAEGAVAGRAPALVSVVGEAGVGKSRLAAEVALALRREEPAPEVLQVRARELAGGEEGETLRALFRWALALPAGPAPADHGRALLSAALPIELGPEIWGPVALALGWLDPAAPELGGAAAAPGALRTQAMRAAGEAIRRRALARPLCVLLDDAHLADGAALDALEYAALAEGGAPLFVCALARPAFADARPAWGERAASREALSLGPLEPAAAVELVRRLLLPAENVPQQAVERLAERTQGIPMLLVELVRGLKRDGLVRRREPEGTWFLATDELDRMRDLPPVEWLAQREIGALPADLAAHARLAALLGDEFTQPELAGVLAELERAGFASAFPHDAQVGTRRLLSTGVLVGHRGERIGFRSPLLREAVARSIAPALARQIHEAAFRWYRGAFSLPESARQPRLARHAEACGLSAEAAAIYLATAEGMRARHAYLEAETLFSRALTALPSEDERSRLAALHGRGLMRYRVGRYQDSITDLSAARETARRLADRGAELESLLDESTALDWMNDYVRSAERVAQARAVAGAAPSPLVAARLALGEGRGLFRALRWPEACAALEDAALRAKALGDAGYETLVIALLLLGVVLPNLGRIDEAEAVLAQALELARERGDQLHLAVVLNNRRNLWVAKKDLARALEDQQGWMRIGRDLGMVSIEYFGEYNLGELLYQAGDFGAAEPHVRRAVEIEARHPEVAPAPVGTILWARLLVARGELAAARARLDEARESVERARREGRAGAALSDSQEVLARMVDLATRDAGEAEWQELLARSRTASIEQEPIEVQEMRGLAALRAGQREQAERALRAALRLSSSLPSVMEGRIRRELASVKAPA